MVPISSLHYFLITETSLAQSEFLFSVSLRVAPRNWERQVQIRSIPQHVGWAIRKIITKNSEFLGYLLHGYFTGKLAISRVNLPLHANFTGTSRGFFLGSPQFSQNVFNLMISSRIPLRFLTHPCSTIIRVKSTQLGCRRRWETPLSSKVCWNYHSYSHSITNIEPNCFFFVSGFFSQVCWRSQPWISKFSWFLPRWWWSCNSINILPSTVAWTWWETDATPSGWPSSMRWDGGPQGVSCWAGWLWSGM